MIGVRCRSCRTDCYWDDSTKADEAVEIRWREALLTVFGLLIGLGTFQHSCLMPVLVNRNRDWEI